MAHQQAEAPTLNISLQRRQGQAYETQATEVFYGGAAFGGKSYLMRVAAILWCYAVQGLQVYLFRREFPDLRKNHMQGPSGFPALLAPWVRSGFARINQSENYIAIGESRINLCHAQHEKDVYSGYQGAEIHVLMVDELTQFTEPMYVFLRGRVRKVGLPIPADLAGRFPRVLCSGNPGGIGHNWVKASFIDPQPPFAIWRTKPEDGEMLRQFIPARMADNQIGVSEDPGYGSRLNGLGRPDLVRAMRDGDWNIVAGGALDDIWTAENAPRIVLEPFSIPASWRIFRAFDWGSSKPFSVGWYAVADGTAPAGVPQLPRGSLVRFAELYGWNGKPNEGSRRLAVDVAREILAIEGQLGISGRVQPGPADSAIYAAENGQCIADDMARMGVRWIEADKRPGSRKAGLERIRKMLQAATVVPREEPCLVIFATCRHAVRTMPTLPRDSRDPDDVDTNAEDHCLAGFTLIRTSEGMRRIDSMVGSSGLVMGPDGAWHRYSDVRLTRRAAAVVEVRLANGASVVGTPDHRLMLSDGAWSPMGELSNGSQLRFVADGDQRHDPRVSRGQVLPVRELLPAQGCPFASGDLGTLQRVDQAQDACSPSGPEPVEQFDREPRTAVAVASSALSWKTSPNRAKDAGAPREPEGDEGLARLPSRSGMAQPTLEAGTGQHAEGGHAVRDVRQVLPDQGAVGQSLLSSELQDESAQAQTVEVVEIQAIGLMDVFNLEVETVHSFVVAGGVVAHNCADEIRYACMSMGQAQVSSGKRPW
jgi:hypothetical protein